MKQNIHKITGITVFTDFDGTLLSQDLGNELFIEFGEFKTNYDLLKSGELNIKDYWRNACKLLKIPDNLKDKFNTFDRSFFDYFVQKYELDPNFITFYDFCKNNKININIVSDGFTNYIEALLQKSGIYDLPIFANNLQLIDNQIIPIFYGASESCLCNVASCKRNSVINTAPPDHLIVFIGDGNTDLCAAEHSDIIFAKNQLSASLNKKRIPHYNFSNFFDIYRIFSNLIKNKTYRIRHQAFLLRKKAFECE